MRPTNVSYTEPVEEDDAIMTVAEYLGNVAAGGFIDYDGFGYPALNGFSAPEYCVYPSQGIDAIPEDATHIVWYNR